MAFTELRRVAWDTETTSPNPLEARIVTAAIIIRGNGPNRIFSYLINPGVPIPPEAAAIHGIDDAKAQAEGQDPKAALEDIAQRLAVAIRARMPVIAFNTAYDWTVLNCELARHDLPTMGERLDYTDPITLIDPHVLDKQLITRLRGTGQRKLKPTCHRYGVQLTNWHTAEADALAALLLTDAQMQRHPQLLDMGPVQLYRAQRTWRAEQQAGLQEWLRRTNPAAHCAPEWPLLTAQGVSA
ncbi:MAG TPA: exonuclease domain-containing protein [Actinomycetes bacterium]|nr:exonuclease domain-containing protein [Actinomycetes bacterium]